MMQPQASTIEVAWPAVIKLYGDHELLWLPDPSAFEDLFSLSHARFQPNDILIDRHGQVFSCVSTTASLNATGHVLPLAQVIKLVRLHLEQQGHCCVSKFHAASIAEAFSTAFDAFVYSKNKKVPAHLYSKHSQRY